MICRLLASVKTKKGLFAAAAVVIAAQLVLSICKNAFFSSIDTKWFNIACPLCRVFDFSLGCIAAELSDDRFKGAEKSFNATIFELISVVLTLIAIHAFYIVAAVPDLFWSGYAMIYAIPSFLLITAFSRDDGYISRFLENPLFADLGFIGASMYLVHRVVSDYILTFFAILNISKKMQKVLTPFLAVILSFAAAKIWDILAFSRINPTDHFPENSPSIDGAC